MNRFIIASALAVAACLLASCASNPESIQPAYVSTLQYQSYTCRQLGEEQERLSAAYASAAKQQHHARTGDTWGVIMLGLPVSSMTGGNVSPEIARLKGEQEAVQKSAIEKNCHS